jgi:hypothetical protein
MAKKEATKVQESKTVELPTAKELMNQTAQKEAEKRPNICVSNSMLTVRSLIKRVAKPSGVSDAEALCRAMVIIQWAASNGLTEVPGEIHDLAAQPVSPWTEMYPFWDRHLRAGGSTPANTSAHVNSNGRTCVL